MNRYGWIGWGIAMVLLAIVPKYGYPFVEEGREPRPRPLVCLDCHRQRNIETNEGVAAANAFCTDCHAHADKSLRLAGTARVKLNVPADLFTNDPHRFIACVRCHTDVARSPHLSLIGSQCRSCHPVHGERQAHDPHLRVDCQACHFASSFIVLDRDLNRVRLSRFNDQAQPVSLSDHRVAATKDFSFCRKCHFSGNAVGAPGSVLPAKSFVCLACHPASLSLGHWMFVPALLIFGLGVFSMVSFWFKGSVREEQLSLHDKVASGSDHIWQTVFSRRVWDKARIFLLDVALQRRILQESVKRWSIHSLIYYAFLCRLILSLFALIVYNIVPGSSLALALIDKNHWMVSFIYDFLGLCILLGIIFAAVQRYVIRPPHVLSAEQDNIALIIIGLLVLSGFVLEGARIWITQTPFDPAAFAFLGYGISRLLLFLPAAWQDAYGSLWYIHAGVWAVFIAYLPFGKLKHMFTTPLSLMLGSGEKKQEAVH